MIIYKCDRCGKLIENMDMDDYHENAYQSQKVFYPRYAILKKWDYLTARI
jgi:DNA-directed RNA polymerase subunit RPC12/RpoP